MRSCCFNPHCSRVKTGFNKVEEQEISLEKDAIVFVRTVPVDGWVYVETQEGNGGYAPMDCLSPSAGGAEHQRVQAQRRCFAPFK